MRFVTMGLVLRQVKVGEADAILDILTPEHGILSAGAKSCLRTKSRLLSGCGLFCYSEFVLNRGRTTCFVEEAQIKNSFFGIRESVESTSLAMYLSEIASILSPTGEDGARQLKLLLNSFYLISENKFSLPQIKAVYEFRTLSEAGFMPDLLCCKECGKYEDETFCFDFERGVLLCGACAEENGLKPNLDRGSLTALRHIALSEDKKIFSFGIRPESMQLLNRVTEQYILKCLDKPPKSLTFLHSVL